MKTFVLRKGKDSEERIERNEGDTYVTKRWGKLRGFLKVETSSKIDGNNFPPKNLFVFESFHAWQCGIGILKKSQQCTFFLISNFVILTLQYTINFNPPGKETAFPVLWTSAVEKLHNFRNLNLMKFLNVQQSQNFFGARRTYNTRAPA